MAATFNFFYKITGVLNGKLQKSGELHNPVTITTSADVISHKEIAVPNTTVTTIYEIGAGGDLASAVAILIVPSVAGNLVFGSSDADNSAIVCRASVPVLLPTGNTLPYQNTLSNRADETAAAITTIKFYQSTGAAGKVEIFGIG